MADGEATPRPPAVLSAGAGAGLGFEGFAFSVCARDEGCAAGEAAAGRSQAGEAFPLAGGVSRPRFDCENNSWAGQCGCILLLPYSPCLLSFVWGSSCSDLPLPASLDAALQSERFGVSRSLPGRLIKRRKDVFQKKKTHPNPKPLAFSPAILRVARLLSWCLGEEAKAAFS